MKKKSEGMKNYILNKLSDPSEISKRLGLKLISVEEGEGDSTRREEQIFVSQAVLPNVTFPGKKWTMIGAAVILDMLVDKLVASALGGPAGTAWLAIQMASLFVDIVDPYGYSNTLSRSDIDELINLFQSEILKILKNSEKKQELIDSIVERFKGNPIADRKFVEEFYEVYTDYWFALPGLRPGDECWGDLEQFRSLSGPPKEGCNQIYKQSYENFVGENGDLYAQQATPENNDRINEAFATIYASIVKNNLKNYRDSVISFSFLALIIIVIIVFLIFFIRYIIKKRK